MFSHTSGSIELPSMPTTLLRIIQITRSDDTSPQQLAEVIMTDQSLTSRVLRLANSAYFCRRHKIETVTDAVLTLGYGYVRNLAASASVLEALFPKKVFPGFDWPSMWKHSVTCAVAAESFSTFATGDTRKGDEAAFVAGLMHDIGKLVVARVLPMKFMAIVDRCREQRKAMIDIEQDILGTNHAQIGQQLAEQWSFPEKLTSGISWHHVPEAALDHDELARAVCAGNMLAKRLGRSYVPGVSTNVNLKDIAHAAQVDIDSLNRIIDDVRIGLKRSSEILSWASEMPYAIPGQDNIGKRKK